MSILISEENLFKSKLLQNPERLLNEDNRQFTTKYSKPRHIDTLKSELLSSGGNNWHNRMGKQILAQYEDYSRRTWGNILLLECSVLVARSDCVISVASWILFGYSIIGVISFLGKCFTVKWSTVWSPIHHPRSLLNIVSLPPHTTKESQ